MSFKSKIVVITGGTGGIGSALVEEFHKESATLVLTGTNLNLEEDYLNKSNIIYKSLDFRSEKSISNFIEFLSGLERIDVLINNAGVNKIDSITDISEDDWDWINMINLKGPFLLTKFISKKMKNQNFGKIINISSIFGVISKEKRATYSSTKWGLIGLTKAVAVELAPYNIQVNAVSPGFVDTKLTRRILGVKEMENLSKKIPIKRLAKVAEIAKVVSFLASSNNTYITGQNIIVDGGYTSV